MPHGEDNNLILSLPDAAATMALGVRLAAEMRPGMVIWLIGDLGAGKTTLTRGLLQGLGYSGRVKSPTYTLVEIYPFSSFNLYHFDLYRFASPEEWEEAGFRDYFNAESICLVEWPEKGGAVLPSPDLEVRLDFLGEGQDGDGRRVCLCGGTKEGKRCVEGLLRSGSG